MSLLHPFQLPLIGIIDRINANKKDIYGKSWLWWIQQFVIPVNRDGGSNTGGTRKILRALNGGRRIIIFPEKGRTSTGKDGCIVSPSGHRIRKVLDEGCVSLAKISGAQIVPIWFHWNVPFEKLNIFFPFRELLSGKLTIVIGDGFVVNRTEDGAAATLRLRDTLLNLAETHIKRR